MNSATQITATAPAGTGTVNVTVTTAGGTSATSAADDFTYVTSATITAVGTLDDAHGTDITTVAVLPTQVGDVLVLAVKVSSPTITASSVSGGGASTWTRITQHTDTSNGVDVELWMGPVTATGASTVTVSFSSSVTSVGTELVVQEFSSGLGSTTAWTLDKASGQTDASSTTVGLPEPRPGQDGRAVRGIRLGAAGR